MKDTFNENTLQYIEARGLAQEETRGSKRLPAPAGTAEPSATKTPGKAAQAQAACPAGLWGGLGASSQQVGTAWQPVAGYGEYLFPHKCPFSPFQLMPLSSPLGCLVGSAQCEQKEGRAVSIIASRRCCASSCVPGPR